MSTPRRSRSHVASVSNAALVASVAAIAVLTLAPLQQDNDVRLRPFSEIGEAFLEPDLGLLLESAANVLLFVPFGAALRLRGLGIGTTALLGLLVSAAIEGAQLLFVSGRTTSVDDLLLNTTGAVLGSAVLSLWLVRQYAEQHD